MTPTYGQGTGDISDAQMGKLHDIGPWHSDGLVPIYAEQKKPEPCPWIRDLDDTVSDSGKATVARIRRVCTCRECAELRSKRR